MKKEEEMEEEKRGGVNEDEGEGDRKNSLRTKGSI